MKDGKIHIPVRKRRNFQKEGSVIRITGEAREILAGIDQESELSLCQIASKIIIEAVEKGMISLDEEE